MNRERLEELFGLDLRSLAAFRIVLAAILLLDLIQRGMWIEAHYTDAGVLPRAVLYKHYWVATNWSFHALSGSTEWQVVLFLVQGAATVAMLVGWHTRIAVLSVWVLLSSLGTRNQLVLQGGDDLLRMLVFWSVFLPMGARWSLDARRSTEAPKHRVFTIASVALMLQVFYMYWCTAYLKWSPIWWPRGAAVEMALRLDIYASYPGKALLWLGERIPYLLETLTIGTLVWEYVGPLVAISPWKKGPVRTFAVFAFAFMHLGFGATLEIGLFWMTSIACWIPFLPSWFWDNLPRKYPSLKSPRGKGTIGEESPVLSAFVLSCLVFVTMWNLRTLDGRANYKNMLKVFPTTVNPIGYALRLDQYWSMFAPAPPSRDGWWVIPATLDDGTEVDLYSWASPVSYERPSHIAATFEGQRWRKFLFNVPDNRHKVLKPNYARWVKNRWEEAHPDAPRVRSLELVLMTEVTLPHGQKPVERVSYGTYNYP